jgi:hypothetical protein
MARYLVLPAILCTLASCGSSSAASSASTAAAASVKCGPAHARTLAHSSQGRVYVQGGSVYGCATGSSHPVRLGGTGACPGSAHIGPVAVAGRKVAYASRTCGVDTSSSVVIVRRLSDGALLSSDSATMGPASPESFQSVGSVVVRSSGAVGWIGSADSILTHRNVIQVFERSGGSVRMLDQGPGIGNGSLKLSGSKLSWAHDGARRSASLG